MAIDTNVPSYTYDKVACPNCMVESKFTPADLLDKPINEDIICEECHEVIISHKPTTKKYSQTSIGFKNNYEWD